MHNIHKIGIGILIGISFATGFALRTKAIEVNRMQAVALSKQDPALASGNRVAALDLEGTTNIDFKPIQTLYTVLKSLREHYVEQLSTKNERDMTYDALKAMLASLGDVNTRFIEPDEMKIITDAQQGTFHGIGATLGIKRIAADGVTDEHLVIVSPITTGPADTAKLQPGDVIDSVDGKAVLPFDPFKRATKILKDNRTVTTTPASRSELRKTLESEQKRIEGGMSIVEAETLLTTCDGKSVELAISRKGSANPIKIKLDGRIFKVDPVESKLIDNGKYGYVKINYFGKETADKFGKAISGLKTDDAKGLVLDLRNLSGGETQYLLDVAKYLTPGKELGVLVKAHNKKSPLMAQTVANQEEWTAPIVALVNAGTARSSEVLASALQESGLAKLVGVNTNGDSVSTTLYGQSDGSAIIITTGKYLTSKSADFTSKGIAADVRIVSAAADDTQLEGATKLLASSRNGK